MEVLSIRMPRDWLGQTAGIAPLEGVTRSGAGVLHFNLSDFWNDFCRLNMPLR